MVAISLIFATQQTNAQTAVFIQGGYDWLDGVAAVGVQTGYWKASVGYFPTKYVGSGDPIAGITWAISWEAARWYESGYYVSIGQNSVGYRSEMSYGGSSWTDKTVSPMWIAMIGYKAAVDNIYFKAGVGYGWCSYANAFTYGLGLGYSFGKY